MRLCCNWWNVYLYAVEWFATNEEDSVDARTYTESPKRGEWRAIVYSTPRDVPVVYVLEVVYAWGICQGGSPQKGVVFQVGQEREVDVAFEISEK